VILMRTALLMLLTACLYELSFYSDHVLSSMQALYLSRFSDSQLREYEKRLRRCVRELFAVLRERGYIDKKLKHIYYLFWIRHYTLAFEEAVDYLEQELARLQSCS